MDLKKRFYPYVFTYLLVVVWIIAFGAYSYVELKDIKEKDYLKAKELSFNTVKTILLFRKWVALQGGVYVPISKNTPPNPYLRLPDRDVFINSKKYTKVNPSYLVKLLSVLSQEDRKIVFRMLSLHPLNPENYPQKEEVKYVQEVVEKKKAVYLQRKNKLFWYFYPLVAEKSCLDCHNKLDSKHEHKEGGILGTLLIEVPFQETSIYPLLGVHLLILGAGCIVIVFLGKELTSSYQEIEKKTYIDPLTKAWNRGFFNQKVLEEVNRAKRFNYPLTMIMIDIDYSKSYNDNYGHLAGDEVLKRVTKSIKEELKRREDFLCRFGGEEFAILLPHIGLEGARYVANKIKHRLEKENIEHAKSPFHKLTVSMGIALFQKSSVEEFIVQADRALYQAKARGRNRIEVFGLS